MLTCYDVFYMDDEAKRVIAQNHQHWDCRGAMLSSVLLFDRFRIYDLLIDGCLIYVLFFVDLQRGDYRQAFQENRHGPPQEELQ